MAEEIPETQEKQESPEIKKPTRTKRPSKFLSIGKYFLILLLLAGQGYLAYAIVDKYYPDVYEKINAEAAVDYTIYELEELVVNPAQTNGKRYLLVEISLELEDEEHIEKLESQKMKLKQEMIEALSVRTMTELVEVQGRENLRKELIQLINSTIGVRSVRNLYFTKYIMQ